MERPETAQRRKRRQKATDEIKQIEKDVLKGIGKLSKAEKNKLLLQNLHSSEEELVETKVNTKMTTRSYRCIDCGIQVTLEGSIDNKQNYTRCNSCFNLFTNK